MTEQRVPWLRGERRSAGAAGAVAARDLPQPPRRPLPEQLPRARKVALLVVAFGLLVGAVAMFQGPLADRCGPVGDVKRCADQPTVPAASNDRPWTPAFESVVPAPGPLLPIAVAPVPAVAPRTATRKPAKAKESVPVRRTADESRESRTATRESSEDESEVSGSDTEDE